MSILVVDVGTSSVRAAVVDGDARVVHEETRPLLPSSPAPGLVEFDATGMAATALDAARAALDAAGRRRPGARGPAPAAHGVIWLPLVPGKWAQAFSNRTDSLASRSSTGEVGKTGTIGT